MSPAAICLAPVGSAAPLGSRIQILLLPHHSSRIDATISFGSGCRRAFGGSSCHSGWFVVMPPPPSTLSTWWRAAQPRWAPDGELPGINRLWWHCSGMYVTLCCCMIPMIFIYFIIHEQVVIFFIPCSFQLSCIYLMIPFIWFRWIWSYIISDAVMLCLSNAP